MPSLIHLQTLNLLLLAPLLAHAQEAPQQQQQPVVPPFKLDEHGEAHFNIPVVVKLAQSGANGVVAAVHRRDEDSTADSTEDVEPAEADAPQAAAGVTHLAAPVFQRMNDDSTFEVNHQGLKRDSDSDPDSEESELEDDDIAKRAAIPDQAIATHTIILVETTGTATSTVSENCSTLTTNMTATDNATGRMPPPMNHTSFPLRNGTNSTLPCNGTEGGGVVIKPTGAGGPKPSAPVYNPANVGGSGGGAPVKGMAAGGRGGEMGAVVALAVVAAAAVGLC